MLDIYDPDVYVKGVPHDAFRNLRLEAPVYFHAEPGGPGFWAVTKHQDVVTVSRRIGHSNPSVTLGVYSHLFGDTDERAASVVETALAGLLGE